MSNPYSVLGVQELADTESIKRAYKQLVLIHHPDKYKQSATNTDFIELQQAYDTLIDPVKKSIIDRQLQPSHTVCQDCVSLGDMERSETGEEYVYPCRCGGTYLLEESDTTDLDEELIVPCTTCTLMLRVHIVNIA